MCVLSHELQCWNRVSTSLAEGLRYVPRNPQGSTFCFKIVFAGRFSPWAWNILCIPAFFGHRLCRVHARRCAKIGLRRGAISRRGRRMTSRTWWCLRPSWIVRFLFLSHLDIFPPLLERLFQIGDDHLEIANAKHRWVVKRGAVKVIAHGPADRAYVLAAKAVACKVAKPPKLEKPKVGKVQQGRVAKHRPEPEPPTRGSERLSFKADFAEAFDMACQRQKEAEDEELFGDWKSMPLCLEKGWLCMSYLNRCFLLFSFLFFDLLVSLVGSKQVLVSLILTFISNTLSISCCW